MLFTFHQGDHTALQSAFSGLGIWAESALAEFPDGTRCVGDEATHAALNGGSWSCDGLLSDGRLVQIATMIGTNGRMSVDVVVRHL
jgi:hypothetical protein